MKSDSRFQIAGCRLPKLNVVRCMSGIAALIVAAASLASAQVESLPAPVVHGNSFEVLSNSRYSVHSGFGGSASRQVLANILWAMNRVPLLGSYRELYVATPQNVYLYDSAANTITVHRAGNHMYNSGASFEVGIACPRNEEAGYAIQAGLLAGIAGWSSSGGSVLCCPQQYATNNANTNWTPNHFIQMVDVFGSGTSTGLTTTVQAVSSDSSLPSPHVTANDTFEVLAAELHQDSVFDPAMLTLDQISQLLWAGCGVTPHAPIGKRGLTIPSAVANYYLTREVYLVSDTAVYRYNNRLPPGTNLTTSDHRLELVTAGDHRAALRAACPRIPSTAPVYIVVCVADTSLNWSVQEAGFAGFQYSMQARGLGLEGYLTAPILPAERSAIISALGTPVADFPTVVFACGASAPTAVAQPPAQGIDNPLPWIRVAGNRPPIHITYAPGSSRAQRLTVRDLAGRLVRNIDFQPQHAGPANVDWDGAAENGRPAPAGVYFARLETPNGAATAHFVLTR